MASRLMGKSLVGVVLPTRLRVTETSRLPERQPFSIAAAIGKGFSSHQDRFVQIHTHNPNLDDDDPPAVRKIFLGQAVSKASRLTNA